MNLYFGVFGRPEDCVEPNEERCGGLRQDFFGVQLALHAPQDGGVHLAESSCDDGDLVAPPALPAQMGGGGRIGWVDGSTPDGGGSDTMHAWGVGAPTYSTATLMATATSADSGTQGR